MSGFDDLVAYKAEAILSEDIYKTAGSSWDIWWDIIDADGTPLNISTGYVVRCEIRPGYGATPLFTFATSGAAGTTNQTSAGHLSLLATPANTAPLATTDKVGGLFDVTITKTATGQKVVWCTGTFIIFPEVTQ